MNKSSDTKVFNASRVKIVAYGLLLISFVFLYQRESTHLGALGGIGTLFYTLPCEFLLLLTAMNIRFSVGERFWLNITLVVLSVLFVPYVINIRKEDSGISQYLIAPFLFLIINVGIFSFTLHVIKNKVN
jgi:hypothetical protein